MPKVATIDFCLWILLCVLIIIGVFGNIISIYIWTRGKRCRKSKFSAFFIILSTLDTLLLIVPGIQANLLLSPLQYKAMSAYDLPCKGSAFVFQLLAQVSMWLIVCLTLTRTIFIYKPWLQIDKCKIYTLTVALIFVIAGINIPHLLYDKIVYNRIPTNLSHSIYIPIDDDVKFSHNDTIMTQGKCRMSTADIDPLTYNIILEGAIFVTVPFLINVTCNCLMILQLFRRMVNARYLGNSLVTRAHRDFRAFTKRVITISVTHCAFTIPQVAFDIYVQSIDYRGGNYSHRINYSMWHRIVTFLFYINSFSNLILYYTTGSDFKNDVKDLLNYEKN